MGVQISVLLRDDVKNSEVKVSGFDLLPLSNRRAAKFGIIVGTRGYHEELWSAANSIFGRVPDWWHTKDEKDEWDEYKFRRDRGSDIEEVRMIKNPISAKLVEIQSKPSAVATRRRRNTSSNEATFDLELSEAISIEHSRSTSNEWSVGSETKVGVEIGGELSQAKTTVEQTISFGYTRGEEKSTTKGNSIEVSDSVSVTLDPGEEAIASLTCTRGTIIVDVMYECSLVGHGMFSYAQKWLDGNRDHPVEIQKVMAALGKNNSIKFSERMGLGFVSDGVAELADA